jgi:hypothetical protein
MRKLDPTSTMSWGMEPITARSTSQSIFELDKSICHLPQITRPPLKRVYHVRLEVFQPLPVQQVGRSASTTRASSIPFDGTSGIGKMTHTHSDLKSSTVDNAAGNEAARIHRSE